ncbi:DUF1634 domain-containing protein [Tepidibacillus infernus]|uniref:DUF1634 domain-containing protein n=1 Tax=Tepidibacillus infernus TaxID=1806172 RepID=UPI003B6F6634
MSQTLSREEQKQDENIRKMEVTISKLLRIGVFISAITIFIGLLLFVISGNTGYPNQSYPTHTIEILKGFLELKPYAVILTGLLLLILTPIFRVAISIIAFIQEKDFLFVVITTIVFVILIVSLFLGKAG